MDSYEEIESKILELKSGKDYKKTARERLIKKLLSQYDGLVCLTIVDFLKNDYYMRRIFKKKQV